MSRRASSVPGVIKSRRRPGESDRIGIIRNLRADVNPFARIMTDQRCLLGGRIGNFRSCPLFTAPVGSINDGGASDIAHRIGKLRSDGRF